MTEKEDLREEVKEILDLTPEEIIEKKKIVVDNIKGQFTLKIPKAFALKAGLDKNKEFTIIVNPKKETLEKTKDLNPKIICYYVGGNGT